jgi:uncharacterized membrane protein
MPSAPAYDERLAAPLRWWAIATMGWASVLIAFLVATPVWVAATTTALLVGLVAGVLVAYGRARVTVQDGVLRAGRATIPLSALGSATPLDAVSTRLLAGREADARAYLLLRPYLTRGVRLEVVDPGDPTPYWLVCTRHPDRLAAAVDGGRVDGRAEGRGR